ncbi:MAG: GAF domain-containing protein [Candidatus Tectomicrobia bacterium]|uniref:histidine kinase n=1 Tax=Tectimicrobiota bacterium TaxID=2528274 RepID=A0A932MRY8_UNCTE|nr:GAF domain-containing protein [Candidatus Tectomicrobia bacterium]
MSAPSKPPSYPSPRKLLLVLAALTPVVMAAAYFADWVVDFFKVPYPYDEFLEGLMLSGILIAPLFFLLFARYFRKLEAAHLHQRQSDLHRETELRQANRSLRILSECNQILVHARTEEDLLTGMCRTIVEIGNYRMAWIGWAEDDPDKTVRPAAAWGDHTDLIGRTRISWGPDESGRGPTGRAIRGRTVITIADASQDSSPGPWLDNARTAGFASSLAAPLLDEQGDVFGALTLHAGQPHGFTASDAEMFRELAADIAFGLRSLRTERERRRQFEENRKLAQAVEQSASGILITDPNGIIEYVNPAFTRTTGYTLDELKGKTPRVLKSGKHPPAMYEKLWKTILAGETYQGQFINKKKDGGEYISGVSMAPVLDEGGTITHFVGVQEDITEFMESQRQLERYTTRLQRLLQLDRDISASLDLDEVFRLVVGSAADLLQIDDVTLFIMDESGELCLRAWHGEWGTSLTRRRFPVGVGLVGRAALHGKPVYVPEVAERPDFGNKEKAREYGLRSYLGVPLQVQGRMIGVLNYLCKEVREYTQEDIDLLSLLGSHAAAAIEKAGLHQEVRANLDFLQSILASSVDAIVVFDFENRVKSWNRAAEAMFGYTAEEAIGKTTDETIMVEEDKAARDKAVVEVMAGAQHVRETVRRRKDGSLVPVRLTSSPVRDAGGKVVARTVIFQDLTQQKIAEREREAYIERLKALNGLIAQISSGTDLDEVFRLVVRVTADFLGVDFAVLFTVENGELAYRADHGGWLKLRKSAGVRPGTEAHEVFRTGKPLYAEDMAQVPGWEPHPWIAEQGIKSFLGIPLKIGERVAGVLATLCRGVRKFSSEDIDLLSLLGNHAAIAIEKASLLLNSQKGLDFLRSVLHASSDPVMVADLKDRTLFWNRAAEELFGYTAEEINEKGVRALLPSEDRAAKGEFIGRVMGGNRVDHEGYRRRKDGTLVPVRITGSPIQDPAGNVVARTVIFRDLTEQKKAEQEREAYIERLKTLNTLIAQISSSLKLDEVLDFVVRSAAELLNISCIILFVIEEGFLVAKAEVGGFYSARERSRFPVESGSGGVVARRGEPYYVRDVAEAPEFIFKDEAKEHGIGSYLGVPLKVGGKVIGVISCLNKGVREFTQEEINLAAALASGAATAIANAQTHAQLQDAFRKLQQSQAMLIRAEKLSSIGTLTAGAAHEILNPANIIGLHAQRLMWENEEGTSPHQSAQVILRNVERISRICDDLRRFSRDEAAKEEPFDPDDALRQCIRPLEPEFRLASVEVSYRLAGEASLVLGEKSQIQQVFFNLLRNAMDAMPEGGTLTVASREAAEDERKWWETRVSDTGTGIPPEHLSRIFDPFFTTKPEDKGTGLGLSVSYGIVESHGGRIWAENNPDKGATFIVRLPVKEKENGEAASAHPDRG